MEAGRKRNHVEPGMPLCGILALVGLISVGFGRPVVDYGWQMPCKIENPNWNEQCFISRGFSCQVNAQGEQRCACRQNSSLTYDPASKECRRRFGAICPPPESNYRKCHELAMCDPFPFPEESNSTDPPPPPKEYRCACLPGLIRNEDAQSHFECVLDAGNEIASSEEQGLTNENATLKEPLPNAEEP